MADRDEPISHQDNDCRGHEILGLLPMTAQSGQREPTRRDFLYIATGSVFAVGAAAATWPLINSMNPSSDVRAQGAPVDVDLRLIEPGQRITVTWRAKPIFIDHRTEAQIGEARAVKMTELRDAQPDELRTQRAEWLVVIGICTHLGCIPLGQKAGDPVGDWNGWFCACHGSQYDSSGRVRKGPAPRNLEIPPYAFVSDTILRIG